MRLLVVLDNANCDALQDKDLVEEVAQRNVKVFLTDGI